MVHCDMIESGRKCGCGKGLRGMYRCLDCHNLGRKKGRWRRSPVRKVGAYYVLALSTEELRKAGVLSVEEIEEAVAEAARMNGWL